MTDLKTLLDEGFVMADPLLRAVIRRQLLTLLIEAQDYARAADLCAEWLRAVVADDRGGLIEALTLQRSVLQAAGHEEEHVAVAERLFELDPYDPGVNNDLAYTWADRGERLEQALEMIRLAVAAEPLSAAFLDSLGWVYYKMGAFDRACTHLSRAVQLLSGRNAVIFDHLGDAEYRLNDAGAAQANWRKALEELERSPGSDLTASDMELLAALRLKLAATEKGEHPPVAPTAAEQPREEQP